MSDTFQHRQAYGQRILATCVYIFPSRGYYPPLYPVFSRSNSIYLVCGDPSRPHHKTNMSNLTMSSSQKPTFGYTNRIYSLKEFKEFDHQLKTHELLIAKTPVNHFEKGRLIPMPQVLIGKEAAVSEIAAQFRNWKVQTRQNVVVSSQGGFNFGGAIRAHVAEEEISWADRRTTIHISGSTFRPDLCRRG